MAMRRIFLAAVVLLLLAGTAAIVWSGLGGPPPRLFLRYGRPATGSPTGDVREIEGVEFVEYDRGYLRVGTHEGCEPGDLVGALFPPLGIDRGEPPVHAGRTCPPRWVEVPDRFCISRRVITAGQYWRLKHPGREVFREMELPKRCFRRLAEDFCARLAPSAGRPVRLPDRRELELVRAGEPVPSVRWRRFRFVTFADEWFRERPGATQELSFRAVFLIPGE